MTEESTAHGSDRQSGHPGGSRSKVHLLLATMLSGAMRFDLTRPWRPFSDRFVLSAGHTVPLIYATLATCVDNRPVRVVRVTDQSQEFLQFAEQNGLQPGTALRVTARNLTAGTVTLRKPSGRPFALSTIAAGKILVEVEKGN